MKNFVKSLAGKTVLFLVCMISALMVMVGITGIIWFITGELQVYTVSENASKRMIVEQNILRSYGYTVLWNDINSPNEAVAEVFDVDYEVLDENQEEVSASLNFDPENEKIVEMVFGVLKDEDGQITDVFYHQYAMPLDSVASYYTVRMYLSPDSREYERANLIEKAIHFCYMVRYTIYPITFLFLLLFIGSLVALFYSAGRKPNTEELFHGPLYKVPYDLLFVGFLFYIMGSVYLVGLFRSYEVILSIILSAFGFMLFTSLALSAASRIKQKTFFHYTVTGFLFHLLVKLFKLIFKGLKKLFGLLRILIQNIPLVWKTVLSLILITIIELVVFRAFGGNYFFSRFAVYWAVEKVVLSALVLYIAIQMKWLKKSGEMLSKGNLSYHTETQGMLFDFQKHGENLNQISQGMSIAIEERLKSERMKTELITNVSHDIKTPLTSIINYAALIREEECENEKIQEYTTVVLRQSEKLKRLLEDLVEAAKASTGNLDVVLLPCEAGMFLTQASGEYEERLEKSALSLIVKGADKELKIQADGRRMWRIFDNLMNNICKYALPGTRVYLSLEEKEDMAVISFKNTSKDPLDIPEEELLERFTRGDASRTTEGNGLGLSIAKSMAELQGGSLTLSIDGDLFKAVLAFPLIKE